MTIKHEENFHLPFFLHTIILQTLLRARQHWRELCNTASDMMNITCETGKSICDRQSVQTLLEGILIARVRKCLFEYGLWTMNVSSYQPCVSICCIPDMVYPSGTRCYWNVSFSSEEPTFPKLFDYSWTPRIPDVVKQVPQNQTGCPGNNTVCYSDCILGHNISTHLLGNDKISMKDSIDGGLTCRLGPKDYCFGKYIPDGTKDVITVCKAFLTLVVQLNLTAAEQSRLNSTNAFTISTMSISLLFFVVTFVIYTIVPELKNLHGLMLRTYISCCFGFYVSQLILLVGPSQISCNLVLALFWLVTCLAPYFWANAISFDIWWTFRSMRKHSDQSTRKKYIIYSGYSWGCPILLIGVALIRELDHYFNNIYFKTGNARYTHCWMRDRPGGLLYYNVAITIATLCNVCLFVLTTINIIRKKKAAARSLEGSDSRRYNKETNRYFLHLKLFMLMGMKYVAGLFNNIDLLRYPPYITYILLWPEYGSGLIIFILFICNNRTRQLLANHLGVKKWVVTQWMESALVRMRTLLRRPQES